MQIHMAISRMKTQVGTWLASVMNPTSWQISTKHVSKLLKFIGGNKQLCQNQLFSSYLISNVIFSVSKILVIYFYSSVLIISV